MAGKFKVAAVQAAAGRIDGPVGDLDRLEAMTAEAASAGARLVCWPECSYPAYFLRSAEHYRETASRRLGFDQVVARLKAIAAKYRVYLVAGLIEELPGGGLANAAWMFDPSGHVALTYRKTFLWHFDREYFTPGDGPRWADTQLGRVGLMICADGRCPELAAAAAAAGVQLLVNPTAWVSTGRSAGELTNPQVEYFIPARAIEHGLWVLSANKVGVEADSIVYCGRSNLVDPSGHHVAILPADEEGVCIGEVDLSVRKRAAETVSAPPADPPPVLARRAEAIQPDESVVVAVLSGCAAAFGSPASLLADLSAQSVGVVIANDVPRAWRAVADSLGVCLIDAGSPAGATDIGPLRLVGGGVESYVPSRAAMLAGAELFIACPSVRRLPDRRLLRTRAAENRIYLAAAADDGAVLIGPGGAVQGESPAGSAMAVVSRLVIAAARDKLMAPGTDVVAGAWGLAPTRRTQRYER